MKLHEKIQYKLRSYMYEQQRKKGSEPKKAFAQSKHQNQGENPKTKLLGALDEMDNYIGEKVKSIKIPKFKKDE